MKKIEYIGNRHYNTKNIEQNVIDSSDMKLRSLYGAFHHFRPHLAIDILSNVIKHNDVFIACELMIKRSSIFDFIQWPFACIITSPINFFHLYAFVFIQENGTFLSKLIECIKITLLWPVIVGVFIHDALVSCARTYTKQEFLELGKMAQVQAQKCAINENKNISQYKWKAWSQSSQMIPPLNSVFQLTFFLGMPENVWPTEL